MWVTTEWRKVVWIGTIVSVREKARKVEIVADCRLSCLFSKTDSGVQSSVGYRVTTCKLGQWYRRGVWIDMGDTTKYHQVVLPTFTKLAQGWVDATLNTERLCFHFQDRFEIRGCNTSRGPFYLSFFSINSVNQRKTGIKSAPRFWQFSDSNCVFRELELEELAFFKVVFLCLAIAEILVKIG